MNALRRGTVYVDGTVAGAIEETAHGYAFTYDPHYLQSEIAQAVSLTLPLKAGPYASTTLFPFFSGLLSEGSLAHLQCRLLRIDERDLFGRLLATCNEAVGAVSVQTSPAERKDALSAVTTAPEVPA